MPGKVAGSVQVAAHLAMIGLNYRTAPLAVRERVSFASEDEVVAALAELPRGSILLATCHRTEIYLAAPATGIGPSPGNDGGPSSLDGALEAAASFLARRAGLPASELSPYLVQLGDQQAIQHLMEVAAGLRSMVVGEGQILGQVRRALEIAEASAAARAGAGNGRASAGDEPFNSAAGGPTDDPAGVLGRLFRSAVRAGKRVRAETEIGKGSPSLASAAVKRLEEAGVQFAGRRVLVVGTGKIAGLVIRQLSGMNPAVVAVASRRPGSAQQWLAELPGVAAALLQVQVVALEAVEQQLHRFDVVFSSTRAPEPVIRQEALLAAARDRSPSSPLWVVDLAVPRDVELPASLPEGVKVLTVDDLAPAGANGLQHAGLEAARAIVRQEVEAFSQWLWERSAAPVIRAMRSEAERIRQEELRQALRRLGPLSDREQEVLQALTHRLVNKLLHLPTVYLKDASRRMYGT